MNNPNNILPVQVPRSSQTGSLLRKWLLELWAASFWFYVITKLFIFDFDSFLINTYAPAYRGLLDFKFFIIIGLLAIVWVITKNRRLLVWGLFTLFYPVIMLWRILFFVFKQKSWLFGFAFINAAISFFKSIKHNFVAGSAFLIAIAIIWNSSSNILIWFSIGVILIVLTIAYVQKFIFVFKPSSVFQIYQKILEGSRKNDKPFLDEEIRDLPPAELDEPQLKKYASSLESAVLFNRFALFCSKRLRDYQNSGLNIVTYVMTLLILSAITMVGFAFINYGLYKIDPASFTLNTQPRLFIFFYYAFNNLFSNSIDQIAAGSMVSQITHMVEYCFAMFLVVILVTLFFSVKSQKYAEGLNNVIEELRRQGDLMESRIRNEFRLMSIEEALSELDRLKTSSLKLLYWFSEQIR